MKRIKISKGNLFSIVFILFVVRIFFLILFPPYIGIANNGDFQRLSIPIGLDYAYNPWNNEHYDDTFFNYITNDFIHVSPIDNGWHQIFTIFPYIAKFLSDKILNGTFDLRFLGFVNACIYFIGIYLLLSFIKRIDNIWCYVFLVLVIIVFGDSYILQYFNSFYTEPGSVTSILILWSLLLFGFFVIQNKRPVFKFLFLIAISIAAIFSVSNKQQDILLLIPTVVIVWYLLKNFKYTILPRIIWCICFLCISGILFLNNTAGGNITTYNVISMDLLSYSHSPQKHLYAMGFNDYEVQMFLQGIGGNAFTNDISWSNYESYFTRTNELKILFHEPDILPKMITKRSSLLFMDDPTLGNYMKESGAAPKEKTQENKLWSKIKASIYGKGITFYLFVIITATLISFFGFKIKYLSTIPKCKTLFRIYAFLPVCNILRFITVMLGDSSHDDIKHFFAINVEFDVIFIINACVLIYTLLYFIKSNSKISAKIPTIFEITSNKI